MTPALDQDRIPREVQLEATKQGARVFRNNVGLFRTIDDDGEQRKIRTGLCKGSSDYIGWYPVEITPDMVGDTVAVFVALEVKTGTARCTKEQKNFLAAVDKAGGIAAVARQAEDVGRILRRE